MAGIRTSLTNLDLLPAGLTRFTFDCWQVEMVLSVVKGNLSRVNGQLIEGLGPPDSLDVNMLQVKFRIGGHVLDGRPVNLRETWIFDIAATRDLKGFILQTFYDHSL